jgi:uncharacterized protein (TIGR04255 family)
MPSRSLVIDLDAVDESPHLPAAPIVEAVIQWRARAEKQWHSEELKRELSSRMPEYTECKPLHEIMIAARFEGGDTARQNRSVQWTGFRLEWKDEHYVAQYSRDGLLFSRLRPYNNWESFAREARKNWRTYRDLADPSEVQRLGVRFINRVELVDLAQLEAFLTQPPKCLHKLSLPVSGFLYQSSHEVPGYRFGVNVSRTIQPSNLPQNEGFGLILDIDAFTTKPLSCEDKAIDENLARLRVLKNKVFFSLLKPSVIKKFKRSLK